MLTIRMPIPEVLAAPPWPRPRKRKALDLRPADLRERMLWEPGEHEAWGDPGLGSKKHPDDHYEELAQASRDRAILSALAERKILPMYVARYLSLEAIEAIARSVDVDVRFIEHYRVVPVALGKYELAAFDALLELYARVPSDVMKAFDKIDSPRIARFLLDKHLEPSRVWYRAREKTAASALVPIALGADAKEAEKARRVLHALDHDVVLAIARSWGEEAEDEVRRMLAPQPLPSKPPKLPAWLDPAAIAPPELLDPTGEPLQVPSVRILCELASIHPLGAAMTALEAVRAACSADSLGRFAWGLTDAWIAGGMPKKDRWALLAVGMLGDDAAVRKLVPLVYQWAETRNLRCAYALEALALARTDIALMHLAQIAAKTKNKTLRRRAETALSGAGAALGLSPEELQDRLVPTLGLDEDAGMWLDYGERRFRVVFDETLAPLVTDESGARLRTLPRAKKYDDGERASHAQDTWKSLKSETKSLGVMQIRRLERAMVTGRSWDRESFERLFVRHPLMIHLARRLVWAVVGGGTFRVAEDRSYASQCDAVFELPAVSRVCIPHPLALPDDVRRAWTTLAADYAIIEPFPQLGRETFVPTDEERHGSVIRRFEGQRARGGSFFALKHRGWDFPDYQMGKHLANGVTALLETNPGLGFLASKPDDQTLGAISLRRAYEKPHVGDLDPITFSELVRDVAQLLK